MKLKLIIFVILLTSCNNVDMYEIPDESCPVEEWTNIDGGTFFRCYR